MADILDRLKAALSDRYRIERELGAGGMATVYLAQDLKHDRRVALKVMRPELSAILGGERFLREIRIAAKLNHPHILALHDSGSADGFLYYVMPHVEGESLRSKIEREKQLSIDEAVALTRQVASALDYAHQQGVIHRDIKPENILLHRGEAVVADFGISLAVTAAGGERLTETGLSLGTPEYMSPEQATGSGELDARADIYSLGAVLYEMVTGEPPQTGATVQAVIAKLLSERPTQPRVVRDSVPEMMDRAIMKALAKVPADRFDSAEQLATALTARVEAEEKKSIVVLPFENLSPDPDNAFFSDGLTEELIAELSGIRALRVISRTTAMRLQGSDKDVATIGRELNVQYALEGSVRKAGNALRITVQLIDAREDAHLWADRYTGTMDDVFEVQERLARKIVEQLKVSLSPEEDDRLTRPRIADPLAYECYLRAKQHLTEFTAEGANRAIKVLKKGLEIEGPNELLYTTMGNAYSSRCIWGSESGEVLEEAEQWAAKAFELNPGSPGGHVVRGSVLFYQGRTQEAVAQFKQALRSDPDNSDALFYLVFVAGCSGHLDAARSYFERLATVDPMAGGVNTRWCDYYSGRFDCEWWCAALETLIRDHRYGWGTFRHDLRLLPPPRCARRPLHHRARTRYRGMATVYLAHLQRTHLMKSMSLRTGALCLMLLACAGCIWQPEDTRADEGVLGSCTIFAASRGNTVLYGNNEDYNNPNTYYWVRPPAEGTYGGVYLGFDNFSPQGGINEKGLAFDYNALPEATLSPHPELPDRGAIMRRIQQTCATVEEAITVARSYNWGDSIRWQVLLADATGDAVVISAGPNGELAFTRKPQGDGYLVSTNFNRANPDNAFDGSYPCWRYDKATEMLERIEAEADLTVDYFRSILDAVHIEGAVGNTLYSNVFDLRQGLIYLYHWHQFDEVAVLNVAEELARAPSPTRIRDLFSKETVERAAEEHLRYQKSHRPPPSQTR
jgi:serine/threonine-protein kinase